MDILLVNPSQKNIYGIGVKPPYPPLGLLYLGAVLLEDGYSVRIVDMDVDYPREFKFMEFIRSSRPKVIGFTTVTPNVDNAIVLADKIKAIYEPFIIFGGPHTTAIPEEVMKEKSINAVIIGEGERTISEFMKHFKQGKTVPVDGMIIKKGTKLLRGRGRKFIEDLDGLPRPAWHLLKHLERYSPPDAMKIPVATILTSRGCPYRCTFCQAPIIWGRKIRRRSIENVISEIKFLNREYNIKEVHIADDDFSHDREWTLGFLNQVKREIKGMRFFFMNGLRIDNVDKEILENMKSAGFINVGFGVESGSQRILNRIKKGLKIDEIRVKFKMAKGMGFKTWAFFVLGLPGETHISLKETVDFSLSLDPDFAKYFYLVPFPGTDVYKEFLSEGYLLTRDFSKYGLYTEPVYELPSLSKNEIQRALLRAYLKFYIRPFKILRLLFRIRTLTEFKLNLRAILFLLKKVIHVA
jgi:anaerobic magnesium-protoporphyrin IX monomethyl ester cyclase